MVKNKSYSTKKYKTGTLRKRALIFLVACLLVGGGYVGFKQMTKVDDQMASNDTTVNLDPPTETDKKETDENKDRLAETNNPDTGSTTPPEGNSNKKSVKPIITEASRNSVRAYISDIFEEGGICTATFTQGQTSLTKTSTGFQNASYTQCAPINYDNNFLSSGKWTVKVTYSSGAAGGTSDASYIE